MPAHVYIDQLKQHIGAEVTLKGWLYGKRSSGKIHFLQVALHDRKDREGLRRLAHGLVYIVVPVNSLPLKFFEAVLRAGRTSGYGSAEMERASRVFEERVVRLERELDELLRSEKLEGVAAAAYAGNA